MITAAIFALLLAQDDVAVTRQVALPNPGGIGAPRALMHIPEERRPAPKISPLNKFEFPFSIFGYGMALADAQGHELRFRIYSQNKKEEGDLAPVVGRTLLRLWDFNMQRLRLDHGVRYGKLVDVYLCWGGAAGGEQRFTIDKEGDAQRRANTIHIYDVGSFTEPVEMVREVAHEYGHATLPPVGGFKTPEDWANGYLGEKIYLRYLRDELRAGRLTPEDTMAATADELDAWVRQNVDPLVAAAANKVPDKKLLAKSGSKAMDSYMGLVLYMQALLPSPIMARSLILIGSEKAVDYPQAILASLKEYSSLTMTIPTSLQGKLIWLPTGKGKLGGVTIKKRLGGWTQVIARSSTVKLVN